MRPKRLEMVGFSTFRERAELDFEGLDLVAFTGPTGAGKSTVIDAITFALYGSVARYDNTSLVAPVIHQLATEARVRLDFESGGELYSATRVVRRVKSKDGAGDRATTKEARLERATTGAVDTDTEVLAADVKELNTTVEELLGLDFKQFTRTIVLPQGEFASFLRDEPANRGKLLQRLLDLGIYERMGQRARSDAKTAANSIQLLEDQLARNPALSDADFSKLGGRVAALEQVRLKVTDKLAVLGEMDTKLTPLRDQVKVIDDGLKRLDAVEISEELPGLDGQLRSAVEQRTSAEQALATARTARDSARAKLDDLGDSRSVAQALDLVNQLAETNEKLTRFNEKAAEASEAVESLTAEQGRTETELSEVEAAVRRAQQAADAAEWTAGLVVGAPCPVCHRDVDSVPEHDAVHLADQAEERRAALAADSKTVTEQLAKAKANQQVVVEEIPLQTERIDLLELKLATLDGPTDVDALATKLEIIEAAEQVHRDAADAVIAADGDVEQRRVEVSNVEQSLQTIGRNLSRLRDSLADLGPPALNHESLVEDQDAIHRWAKDTSAELSEKRAKLADEGKRLAKEKGELTDELSSLGNSVGLSAEPKQLLMLLSDAGAEAKADLAAAEQHRKQHQEIDEQIQALTADRAINESIGKHLRSDGFGSWLLAEALDNIVAKATVWLRSLSNDQYSLLAGEKNFAIVDHNNADETRDVRTLSGGETFLASLALALALADSIAELAPVDSPKLESMFLDEGFGTLDPGTLDVVAAAIEELASTGRMIGIVTHVNDLAERMPARFEIRKGPSTSTVELVEV